MRTLKQLEDQGRALAEEQKSLVMDESRPWSQKRAEYDRREQDIRAVLDQHKALKSVDGDPFAGTYGTDSSAGSRNAKGMLAGVLAQGGHELVRPPQLDLTVDDTKQLYEAAQSHKTLSVASRDRKATDSTSIAPAGISDYRLPPVTMRREPTRVLSLIPVVSTQHPTVTWYTTAGTTAAAAVAEGGTKPTSTIGYTPVTSTVTKIAHVAEVTDETLQDFPAFMGVMQQDMVAGLILAENNILLNATVAGASKFAGLLNVSGILTRARTTEPYLDVIEMALDDLRIGSAFAEPDGMIMHPTTWGLLRRQKDSQNRYYLQPDVTQTHNPSIWGVPVVLTTQIAAGTILVGDFLGSTIAYVREGIRVESTNQGTVQFTTNTTLVRAEERLLVTAPRPTGLLKITGIS